MTPNLRELLQSEIRQMDPRQVRRFKVELTKALPQFVEMAALAAKMPAETVQAGRSGKNATKSDE